MMDTTSNESSRLSLGVLAGNPSPQFKKLVRSRSDASSASSPTGAKDNGAGGSALKGRSHIKRTASMSAKDIRMRILRDSASSKACDYSHEPEDDSEEEEIVDSDDCFPLDSDEYLSDDQEPEEEERAPAVTASPAPRRLPPRSRSVGRNMGGRGSRMGVSRSTSMSSEAEKRARILRATSGLGENTERSDEISAAVSRMRRTRSSATMKKGSKAAIRKTRSFLDDGVTPSNLSPRQRRSTSSSRLSPVQRTSSCSGSRGLSPKRHSSSPKLSSMMASPSNRSPGRRSPKSSSMRWSTSTSSSRGLSPKQHSSSPKLSSPSPTAASPKRRSRRGQNTPPSSGRSSGANGRPRRTQSNPSLPTIKTSSVGSSERLSSMYAAAKQLQDCDDLDSHSLLRLVTEIGAEASMDIEQVFDVLQQAQTHPVLVGDFDFSDDEEEELYFEDEQPEERPSFQESATAKVLSAFCKDLDAAAATNEAY